MAMRFGHIATDWHEDDFYQRMLDLGAKTMGVPIHYGSCQGGPFAGRDMAHATESYRVAIDRHSKKVVVAVQAGEYYDFGVYRWDGKDQWIWNPEAKSRAVGSSPA